MDLDLFDEILTSGGGASTSMPTHSFLLSDSQNSVLTSQQDGDNRLSSLNSTISEDRIAVISKIENIIESMVTCILEDKNELTIHLKSRKPAASKNTDEHVSNQGRAVTFPGKTVEEAWKFTVLLRILELSRQALVNDRIITKREIYYSAPDLFIKQSVVDRYVDDLAYTFGINRSALNVVAAAKGLIAGSLRMIRKDGTQVDCSLENDGILVPDPDSISSFDLSQTNWILVIEKEASFRSLATNRYWGHSEAGRGVLITAKGYPDIQTRSLLYKLSRSPSCPPIHCLVDFDPDGINILSTYKHGSARLGHETNLTVPAMNWLGVKSSDIMFYQNESEGQGLLSLTVRDRKLATRMLGRQKLDEVGGEAEWRRELQVMLMLGVKAEIQIVNGAGGAQLQGWLDRKLLGLD